MTDAYGQVEIEPESYSLLQDEYLKLKSAYQKLRNEHLTMKKGIVTTVGQCWTKIDKQYNCKNSMSESLNRLGSVDVAAVGADDLLGDLRTQIETMLRQVYLNCEINKSLEVGKLKEEKYSPEITDLSDFVCIMEQIQETVEAFNNMLENVSLQQLVANAPDETHSERINLSNKTIVQVLNSMRNVMENPERKKYPKRLRDLQSQCFELLNSKANLTMMWNNQFLTCIEQLDNKPQRSLRKPRLQSSLRSLGTQDSRDSDTSSQRARSRSTQLLIRFTNSMLPDEARIRGDV